MLWIYVSKEHNPDGTARFGARADARLRMSVAAAEVADLAAPLVPLVGDARFSDYEFVAAAGDTLKAAEQLVELTVVRHLAEGRDWAEVAEALKISEDEARRRYQGAWEHFELTQPIPRDPKDPTARHLRRDLDKLDAWCATHLGGEDPGHGISVTGGLVWPHTANVPVFTQAEAEQAAGRAVQEAEFEIDRAAFRTKYDAALTAALAKLAAKGGLGHTALWADRKPPYVVARDGRHLGTVHRQRHGREYRWTVDGPGVDFNRRDELFPTMAAAIGRLDTDPAGSAGAAH